MRSAATRGGRTANKGAEGLALTPDGKTLVMMVQAPLIQDQNAGATNLLRFVTIDVASGAVTHEYAYNLTKGSGVSEILALNNDEVLVDERDGKGLGDGSSAKVKQVYKVRFTGAADVSNMDGATATANAVPKTLFLDLVNVLKATNLFTATTIPAKIEGLAFGPDVQVNGVSTHTLWVANDNDFLQDYNGATNSNPNRFFCVRVYGWRSGRFHLCAADTDGQPELSGLDGATEKPGSDAGLFCCCSDERVLMRQAFCGGGRRLPRRRQDP